jgi:hypothetical protein
MSSSVLGETVTGDVGIFWVDRGQLIIAAVSLADGVDDGVFVNGPDDHDPYWPIVQRTHANLRGLEYYQVPRGRVLFNKTERRFYGYLDKVLDTPVMKRMIMARFHLPRKHTTFQTDLHYTTDPDELDRLFSR